MKKLLYFITISTLAVSSVACSVSTENGASENAINRPNSIDIVAATELEELEPLVEQASKELGVNYNMVFEGGTLSNSRKLLNGNFDNDYEATWFATNKYAELIGASDKQGKTTKVATSPVILGVKKGVAQDLGWDSKSPQWSEIVTAVDQDKLDFGMTDPSESNSGFSSLIAVSTALAGRGESLNREDIDRVTPELKTFFNGLSVTSGSSGWLKNRFMQYPNSADAIFNYESVVYNMIDEGADIIPIIPEDGVINADYPLSQMSNNSEEDNEKIENLVQWLLDHQADITQHYLRPVDNTPVNERLGDKIIIDLPYPGSQVVTEYLVDKYNDELRRPGNTVIVVDTSGSMRGNRIESLEQSLRTLNEESFRNRETVSIVSFSGNVNGAVTDTIDKEIGLSTKIDGYIDTLNAGGETAIYSTLIDTYEDFDTTNDAVNSIVLMTDGENTRGVNFKGFKDYYDSLDEAKKSIPVFIILYGESSEEEMEELAALTGGKTFNGYDDLHSAFNQIRSYQ